MGFRDSAAGWNSARRTGPSQKLPRAARLLHFYKKFHGCSIGNILASLKWGPSAVNEDRDIDIESFRRSRSDRLIENLKSLENSLFRRGWMEVEAEVCECILPHWKTLTNLPEDGFPYPLLNGYVVSFTYTVNGTTYEGVANSPDELLKHDKFKIRYNSSHPEENNTFDSASNWAVSYTKYLDFFLAVLLLLFLIGHLFLHW